MNHLRPCLLLSFCGALAAAMFFAYDDSCQQDAGLHFLYARWAWEHPVLFVGVWSRPLFTFLYAFPALIDYQATRLFTVLICLAIAWQTWRLAEDLKIERSAFSIVLVWLQPSFYLFCADNMTEPIFALVFVIALRLHHQGRIGAGMLVASLMILARPEGFFLGVLWAFWAISKDFRKIPLLAAGSALWWLAAFLITRDPLFIIHNWPANWPLTGTVYGAAGLFAYPLRLPEIVGPFLLPPFIYGLVLLLKRKEHFTLTSTFLLFFILHTILRAFGLLGSAGYPRYLVAIAPAIALITLVGWNELAKLFSHVDRKVRIGAASVIIILSAYTNFVYADAAEWSRDALAVRAAHEWFLANPRPVTGLIWSKPYAGILFDRDPWENPAFTRNKESDLKLLKDAPPGTLAVWDERVGPGWFGLTAKDLEAAGFTRLHSQSFALRGYILDRSWFGFGGARDQTIHLLYKGDR